MNNLNKNNCFNCKSKKIKEIIKDFHSPVEDVDGTTLVVKDLIYNQCQDCDCTWVDSDQVRRVEKALEL